MHPTRNLVMLTHEGPKIAKFNTFVAWACTGSYSYWRYIGSSKPGLGMCTDLASWYLYRLKIHYTSKNSGYSICKMFLFSPIKLLLILSKLFLIKSNLLPQTYVTGFFLNLKERLYQLTITTLQQYPMHTITT